MTTITINGAMTLGELLAFYRQRSGIDQTDMAARLGSSRATISAWERDAREPNFSQVVLWARITGQPLEPLVEAVEARYDETPADHSTGVSDVARPEGLEPPTF